MKTKIFKYLGEIYYPYIFQRNPMHGISHTERVFTIGYYLCTKNREKGFDIDVDVVTWFSFLHDICRQNDGDDCEHSDRAAAYAKMIRDTWLSALTNHQFNLLYEAIKYHNKIKRYGDITIDTCFDADRLDLPRCTISVRKDMLATEEAKALFESYNGDYLAYTKAAIIETTRLKFYDHCVEIRTMPKVGVRCNLALNGKSYSPSCWTEWDIGNAKSVTPYYDTLISGIFVFPYSQIQDIQHIIEDFYVPFYNAIGQPYDYIQLVLLQYDNNCVIGNQKNTYNGNGDELILSQANIMGVCPVSEHAKSDMDAIVKQYSTEQKPIIIN